jgi:hypothetical protein
LFLKNKEFVSEKPPIKSSCFKNMVLYIFVKEDIQTEMTWKKHV